MKKPLLLVGAIAVIAVIALSTGAGRQIPTPLGPSRSSAIEAEISSRRDLG